LLQWPQRALPARLRPTSHGCRTTQL
jgi:hypothetical protein